MNREQAREAIKTIADLNRDKTELLERIKRLEEFVEQLHNPQFTIEDLPKEALLQHIKRLEEAGDNLARFCVDGFDIDRWNKAKEPKDK